MTHTASRHWYTYTPLAPHLREGGRGRGAVGASARKSGRHAHALRTRSLAVPLESESSLPKIFWTCAAGVGLCFLLYAYFVGAAVMHIVGLKDAEIEMREISKRVSVMEGAAAAFETSMNLDAAKGAGFVEIENIAYVPKTASFTLRHQRSGTSGNEKSLSSIPPPKI